MEDTKPWYASQTIWASVLTVLLGIAQTFGLVTADQSATLLGELPTLFVGLVTAGLGAWALYGRVRATTTVTATK